MAVLTDSIFSFVVHLCITQDYPIWQAFYHINKLYQTRYEDKKEAYRINKNLWYGCTYTYAQQVHDIFHFSYRNMKHTKN